MLFQVLKFLDGLECHNFQPLKQHVTKINMIDLINRAFNQIEFFNKERQKECTPKIDEKIDKIENRLNLVKKAADENFENYRIE